MQEAKRIQQLPSYLFATIEKKIADYKARGIDVISLGIGDPDQPTPAFIIEEMAKEIANPANHQYPSSVGLLPFRQAAADWYRRRYGVTLDPQREVVALLGSKEGIANISYCYIDPGDIALVPDPGYPVYGIGTQLAGGTPYLLPLKEGNGFLPVLSDIPAEVAAKAKILWLNYPNNPTGAVADLAFFEEAVAFAKRYDLLVCHDSAYSEVSYDGYRPPSILQVPGAKEVALEFHSLSKPFNMTGWRVGFAAGHGDAASALARYKSNVDSGVFQAIQYAAIAGLQRDWADRDAMRQLYKERRDLVVDTFNSLGWQLSPPQGAFYIWAPVPKGFTSTSFAEYVLDKANVVVTPGSGYGVNGEGYFRISLTIDGARIKEAAARIRQHLGRVSF